MEIAIFEIAIFDSDNAFARCGNFFVEARNCGRLPMYQTFISMLLSSPVRVPETIKTRPVFGTFALLHADVSRKSILPSPFTSPIPVSPNPSVSPDCQLVQDRRGLPF
jgi:hypothetical protein